MTQTHTRLDTHSAASRAGLFARQITSGIAKLTLAAMIVMAAGLVAMMTAIAGLMIAGVALVMRFTAPRRELQPVRVRETEGVTLNARRTPRGWTVE